MQTVLLVSSSYKVGNNSRVNTAVVFLLNFHKHCLSLDNMDTVVLLTKCPVAVRHSVHGTEEVFIVIKRPALGGCCLDLLPQLIGQPLSRNRVVISISGSPILRCKIKSDAAYCYIILGNVIGMDIRVGEVIYVFFNPVYEGWANRLYTAEIIPRLIQEVVIIKKCAAHRCKNRT